MDYMDLLRRHDDPTHWDLPDNFDYESARARVEKFAAALASAFGFLRRLGSGQHLELETGSLIQDASFHSQILIPIPQPGIRFSNFGDMVSVWDEKSVSPELLQTIRNLCDQLGYVYVPEDILKQPYTGSNPGVSGIPDWWTRYFNWL